MKRIGLLKVCALGLCVAALLFSVACQKPKKQAPVKMKPLVVVSVVPQASFVEQITGDLIDVDVLIPPGASPATFEPTLKQVASVADAKLFFTVGHPSFPFEAAWMDRLKSGTKNAQFVNSSEGLEYLPEDPHVWVSPKSVMVMAKNMLVALQETFPEHRVAFEKNYKDFIQDVAKLDLKVQQLLETVTKRRFLVFHPAWGYFARDYGLEQVSIEHEGKEPSAHQAAEVIEAAKEQKISMVFVQKQFSAKSANVIAREIGGQVVIADPLAADWFGEIEKMTLALASR